MQAHPDPDIDSPFALRSETIAAFERDGFVKLPEVLSPAAIAAYAPAITAQVTARAKDLPPLEQRSTYGKAFLQVSNLWPVDETIHRFVFAKRLARLAAELLGCRGVRLYHDQALDKEPGGGFTPWHVDQQYWPLATPKCVTAWIPLQAVPLEMGPLAFAIGSQRIREGRELAISDESEIRIGQTLHDVPKSETAYALGEVSFHAGWTFHRAGPNRTDRFRRVMTIIYMDIDMRLKEPENKAQRWDWGNWCPGATVGGIIDSPLNPVLWQAAS
ncbi:phytanoyl-CoA dioxygenase [Planctomycetota bacterium]|nr:phytanoyl-CoA dioxygenase [Planctomycetota bacterium]